MFIDHAACDAFLADYRAWLPADHPHRQGTPDRFGFGGEPALADELAGLMLEGRKRATASLAVEFSRVGEPLPRAGDLSIIVAGDGRPVAVIERTRIDRRLFDQVDAAFAATEGEGDGSLAYWRQVHQRYFSAVLAEQGQDFDGAATEVICQEFRVVWPVPRRDP